MQIIKTVDTEEILRLEEEEGSSISIKKSEGKAQVLSIFVQKDDRREGIGSTLLFAAENILYDRGIRSVTVDFSDMIKGMEAFFENAGYIIEEGAPIISVNMKELLTSVTARKLLVNEDDNLKFVPLSELMVEQLEALMDGMASYSVNLGASDIARFIQEASGVVFDKENRPQAFILCSDGDESIHVDFLAGGKSADPKTIVAAIRGMMEYVINEGGARTFETLTLIGCNKKITRLLEHVLKKGIEPDTIGHTLYAERIITSKHDLEDTDIDEDEDEDMEDEWQREIRKVPMQRNILWKMPWHRLSGDALGSDEQTVERKTSAGRASSDKIAFEKYEELTEGLTMDNTVRITEENLSDFNTYLPADVYKNMPRPFYRGLAVKDGEDILAAIVWEYKNIEDEEETKAEIIWLDGEDKESLETVIEEFTNEIRSEETEESYFEFDELPAKQKKVLLDAGFSVKDGESRDIVMRVSQIASFPFASKAPLPYIRNIGTLEDKQFKRGITNSLFHKRKGLMEDILFLPKGWFDNEMSSCVVTDSKVTGLLLLHKNEEEELYVDLLFSVGAEYKIDLVNLIRFSVSKAMEKYGPDTKVIIRRHSAETEALAKTLFPEKEGEKVVLGERRED